MDLGLDDIIKNKWKNGLPGRRNRGGPRSRIGKRELGNKILSNRGGLGNKILSNRGALGNKILSNRGAPGKVSVMDARAKINARKRIALKDAREKLNALQRQKDARLRLSSLNTSRVRPAAGRLNNYLPVRTINNAARQMRATMDSYPYPAPARRNNSRPAFRRGDIGDGPLSVERRSWDPATLRQINVLVYRPNSSPRELRTNKEDSWLRPSLAIRRSDESIKSRLEPLRQEEGYRIVVSNLQPTVTHEDIKELFEDIGPLLGSRVVRPGTAEVVYRDLKDAMAAVDAYHNRQLDGQPMKCLLVKPSSSSNKSMVGTKGMVVPDISTIHKALFMK